MGEVIYAASTLKAFLASFVVLLFLFLLGLLGVLNGIFRRQEKTFVRIARGCAGFFLWVIPAVFAFLVFRSMTTGAEEVTVHVNEKQIAHDNCGDNSTCDRHILETQSGTKFYDMEVSEEAYDKVQIDSCYKVTYFSGAGFFGPSTQPESESTYQYLSTITRIETAACP